MYSDLHSSLLALLFWLIWVVAFRNLVRVWGRDSEQADVCAGLGLKRVKICLLLANLVPSHNLFHAYSFWLQLAYLALFLWNKTVKWRIWTIEFVLVKHILAGKDSFFKYTFTPHSFLPLGVALLSSHIVDHQAASEKFSHWEIIVKWSWLQILVALKGAHQDFVWHWVKHVQKLVLLNLDHLTWKEQFDLNLHVGEEDKFDRDQEDEEQDDRTG